MEFRDLKRQYTKYKAEIDAEIGKVLLNTDFISGKQVTELEENLATFVGRKYCISCANGTDALQLALMALEVGAGDAVFVPDFTFFSTAEVVALCGATPIFVDIQEDTFTMCPEALKNAIKKVIEIGDLMPRVIIAVDLFGLPADYVEIEKIAECYNLQIVEDAAQGFGGKMNEKNACSFGIISTTSFFPAKPLGCYGDGGALFTDDENIAVLLKSLHVHGKGHDKYDNVRIGMNSRLDTLQAAILKVKFNAFVNEELDSVNNCARMYTDLLNEYVKTPIVPQGFYSSWAQYSILMDSKDKRDGLMEYLKEKEIPSMVYYRKPLHTQEAFVGDNRFFMPCPVTERVSNRVLSLPMHPYLTREEICMVADCIKEYLDKVSK